MRKVLKWLGIGVGGLIVLALVVGGALAMMGRSKLNGTYPMPALNALRVEGDAAQIARGEHVAIIHGCTGCHAEDLGGMEFLDIPPGKITAPNLTRGRGGVGSRYTTAEDWDRAVRHGLRPDGRAILPFMPWRTFSRLSDADAAALIAFLQQAPAVDRELPATEIRLPGYLMLATMEMGEPAPPPPANRVTEPEPTAAYGQYLASHTCVECHGEDLNGATGMGPQGPSLAGAAQWPLEQFTRAVRQGIAPGERKLSEEMPSLHFAHLTDVEVQALHSYLKTLTFAAE